MPSPAVQKLEALPLTPLQSAPTSPASSSKPSSRRGSSNIASSSSSIQQFRKQSHGAHTAVRPNLGALSITPANATGSGSNSANADRRSPIAAPFNASVLTSIKGSPSSNNAKLASEATSSSSPTQFSGSRENEATAPSNAKPINQAQVSEAVDEEQMLSSSVLSSHAESALDDEETDDEEADEGADVDGTLRTGNARFRSGSRRLSRLSSTLGEGITAHWKRSTPASAETKSPAELAKKPEESSTSANAPPAPVASSSLPASAGLPDVHTEQKPSKAAKTLSPIEQAKRLAAYRAVDVHVKPHHRVIGIGSGSTVPYVVDRLLEQGEEANKKRWVSLMSARKRTMH